MADAMGLGKTLTVLALVIASRKEPAPGYCGATLIGTFSFHFDGSLALESY